jgi:hypothetical protein
MDVRGRDDGIIEDNIPTLLEEAEEYPELTLRMTDPCIETESCEVPSMKQDC